MDRVYSWVLEICQIGFDLILTNILSKTLFWRMRWKRWDSGLVVVIKVQRWRWWMRMRKWSIMIIVIKILIWIGRERKEFQNDGKGEG